MLCRPWCLSIAELIIARATAFCQDLRQNIKDKRKSIRLQVHTALLTKSFLSRIQEKGVAAQNLSNTPTPGGGILVRELNAFAHVNFFAESKGLHECNTWTVIAAT